MSELQASDPLMFCQHAARKQLDDFVDRLMVTDLHGWSRSSLKAALASQTKLLLYQRHHLRAVLLYRKVTSTLLEIDYLATATHSRGGGLMGQVLAEFCRRHAGCEVWLECRESNQAAIALYGRHGFRQVGRRPNYYLDGSAAILFSF